MKRRNNQRPSPDVSLHLNRSQQASLRKIRTNKHLTVRLLWISLLSLVVVMGSSWSQTDLTNFLWSGDSGDVFPSSRNKTTSSTWKKQETIASFITGAGERNNASLPLQDAWVTEPKVSPQTVDSWLSSDELQPPNTPAAFIHVGKTGGSTLCYLIRNACHSFLPKPCSHDSIENESYISQLATYYHTPDFHLLPKINHYAVYIWTLRDPYSRTLSAFTFEHPLNIVTDTEAMKRRRVRKNLPTYKCFPTLESFATAIGDHPSEFHYPFQPMTVNSTNCTNLARAIMQSKVRQPDHLYYSIRHVLELMPRSSLNATILVVRAENMWDDWITANQWLGQTNVTTWPGARLRDQQDGRILPVSKNVSRVGQKRICRALSLEYRAYFEILDRAANLGEGEKKRSIEIARENCPYLDHRIGGIATLAADSLLNRDV